MKPYLWIENFTSESIFFGWILQKLLHNFCHHCWINVLCVLRIDSMGDIGVNRLNGARELLAIAITEREIYNIRELFRERIFCRKICLIGKCFIFLLAMCLMSEINVLRLTTVVLLVILVGLSFYLIVQSWSRCEALTARLTQELQDFRDLMASSANED